MSGDAIGFISIGIMILINTVTVAFFFGGMQEKIKSLGYRVKALEERPSPICSQHITIDDRLRDVEIQEGQRKAE